MSPWKQFEGRTLDRKYRLRRFIGEGSFGGVFLADQVLGDRNIRRVAVKVIPYNATNGDQQLQELQQATSLSHPGIVRSFDVGSCRLGKVDVIYLVMEPAEGNLRSRVASGPLNSLEVMDIAIQLAEAIAYMHDLGLVHRDIKPDNVLSINGKWKLSDLGITKNIGSHSSIQTSSPTGTWSYMPPEAWEGVVSAAWDLWSLGVVMLECLLGSHPFVHESVEAALRAIHTPATLQIPPWVPRRLRTLVYGCLDHDRSSRLTARAIHQQLTELRRIQFEPPPSLAGIYFESFSGPDLQVRPDDDLANVLERASPGTTIKLGPERYLLTKTVGVEKPIRITGSGMDATTIVLPADGKCLSITAPFLAADLTFEHRSPKNAGLFVEAWISLQRCRIRGRSVPRDSDGDPKELSWVTVPTLSLSRCSGSIEDCIFEKHIIGISLCDSSVLINSCNFLNNACAVAVVGDGVYSREVHDSCGGPVIKKCIIMSSRYGVLANGYCRPSIIDCRISENDIGVSLHSMSQPVISNTACVGNHRYGIFVTGHSAPTIQCSCFQGNGLSGVSFREKSAGVVENSVILCNGVHGIALREGSCPGIIQNVCYLNYRHGIAIRDHASPVVMYNRCWNNAEHGIDLTGESSGCVEYNWCIENAGVGICMANGVKLRSWGANHAEGNRLGNLFGCPTFPF